MEDCFKVRVDRAFGSLQTSSSSSSSSTQPNPSSLTSLWSLTDEEIERNKWIQEKIDPQKETEDRIHRLRNPKPFSPFLQGIAGKPSNSGRNMKDDLEELEDDDDDDEDENEEDGNVKRDLVKPDDHSNEEWDIRSSVGMDCTLDNEEEEDAYDKVAIGKDSTADRFYMKAVNDYEVDIDSNNELPSSFTDVLRDPRANHLAAKLRLKEDDDSARKLGLQIPENKVQESNQTAKESKQDLAVKESPGSKAATFSPKSLPDYLRNPSKYTRYTFDSSDDMDEASNRKAYMDLFSSLKRNDAMEIQDDVPADSTTPIIFTPRKKSSDVLIKKSKVDGYEDKKAVSVSFGDSEASLMDEDEDEDEMATNRGSSVQKSGRRYRIKGGTSLE